MLLLYGIIQKKQAEFFQTVPYNASYKMAKYLFVIKLYKTDLKYNLQCINFT